MSLNAGLKFITDMQLFGIKAKKLKCAFKHMETLCFVSAWPSTTETLVIFQLLCSGLKVFLCFLSWLHSFELYTCPEGHLHIYIHIYMTKMLLAYSNV